MSFIEIEIGPERVINEKPIKVRGLMFNNYTWHAFLKKIDLEFYEASSKYAATYAALRANSFTKGEQVDYTFQDVVAWVDLLSKDALNLIRDNFEAMEEYKSLVEVLEEQVKTVTTPDEEKKN